MKRFGICILLAFAATFCSGAESQGRLIVMPFRPMGLPAKVYGTTVQPSSRCEEIASKVNDALSRTGRFRMLSRAFDDAINAEISRLKLDNAATNDLVKAKQMRVADLMVTGTLKVFDSPTATTNPYSGTTQVSDGPFLEIAFRLIHVPTTEQLWANTIIIPYSSAGGGSVDAMFATAFATASDRISAEIVTHCSEKQP